MNNAKYDLIEGFNRLESKITELSQLIAEQPSISATVFRLPDVMKGEENNDKQEKLWGDKYRKAE